ncbi:MAG: aminopeptidase [Deltaproteobacteria bacterium]|nr:aminopeptidase [Deltaproteobacteria bacterium]
MQRLARFAALAVALALVACGGDDDSTLRDKLRALPGVTVDPEPTDTAGYSYYILRFTQPVDHDDPGGPTFQQLVSFIHRDDGAPMVVHTTGYWDYTNDRPVELTRLLRANQLSIEHRFFATSRPEPADWTKLTIKQMADDQHAIITALRGIFPDVAFLTTGGSKGGMTAMYHRRFYPDDVEGTVPYVAPQSFGAPDPRYATVFDTIGPPACRQAVRDLAVEMLQNRRAALLARAEAQAATDDHVYTRILIGPAVESSVVSLEWAYWQYFGNNFCDKLPATTDTDQKLFDFLETISPVGDNDDASIAGFEAYYYQAYAQLGYPDGGTAYLEPYLMYTDRDYDNVVPTGLPAYDGGAAMHDIDGFVRASGDRLLFVYGEWDPWTAGRFELGGATDSLSLTQPRGTHGARLARLADADREAAFARLEAWTGVKPVIPMAPSKPSAREPDEPRLPPAVIRRFHARR